MTGYIALAGWLSRLPGSQPISLGASYCRMPRSSLAFFRLARSGSAQRGVGYAPHRHERRCRLVPSRTSPRGAAPRGHIHRGPAEPGCLGRREDKLFAAAIADRFPELAVALPPISDVSVILSL